MKALAAAVLLLSLGACGAVGADAAAKPAPHPVAGKPLLYAPPPPPLPDEGAVCAEDIRLCADGSTVSRNPAKGCAFDPCPGDRNP
jgi:hypothetical protein